MTVLELPGYDVIVPNELYSIEIGTISHKKSQLNATKLLKIQRTRIHEPKELLDEIARVARIVRGSPIKTVNDESELESTLRRGRLPYLSDIVDRNPELVERLTSLYQERFRNFGDEIISGIITKFPTYFIKKMNEKFPGTPNNLYYESLIACNNNRLEFTIFLDEGSFPIEVIEDNDGYIISPHNYRNAREEFNSLVELFRTTFDSPEKILQLTDKTNKTLDTNSAALIQTYRDKSLVEIFKKLSAEENGNSREN